MPCNVLCLTCALPACLSISHAPCMPKCYNNMFFTVPRFGNKREQYFSPACEKVLKWWSIFLALCIICFGPCVGVVAAGTIFGAYGSHPHAAYRGQTIRTAASYVRGLPVIFVHICIRLLSQSV